MIDQDFKLDVAKLMVAAAWADGRLQSAERNVLKDLMWELGELGPEQWAQIEIYMDSPLSEQEHLILEDRVLSKITTPEQKDFISYMINKLLSADGHIGQYERQFLVHTQELIDQTDTGITARLSGLLKSLISPNRRTSQSAGREDDIQDFLRNRIYFALKNRGFDSQLPEDKVRQLCFAAGLLGLVANIDNEICSNERAAAEEILTAGWNLTQPQAQAVVDVASEQTTRGLDKYRLTDGFYQSTDRKQRQQFIACLFKIAAASGKASNEEIEEIRSIASGLKLSHDDFIAAKLTLNDEQLGL